MFENCSDGFEYVGLIENGVVEGCAYYINQQISEWIYVEQEVKRIGTADDFVIPYNDFGSNTHQKEEQIYANKNDILLNTTWETSFGTHEGFLVYIRSKLQLC